MPFVLLALAIVGPDTTRLSRWALHDPPGGTLVGMAIGVGVGRLLGLAAFRHAARRHSVREHLHGVTTGTEHMLTMIVLPGGTPAGGRPGELHRIDRLYAAATSLPVRPPAGMPELARIRHRVDGERGGRNERLPVSFLDARTPPRSTTWPAPSTGTTGRSTDGGTVCAAT